MILAWGSFTAGFDLWNLRPRGRRLAILAALIIFLYGGRTYFVAAALGQIPARDTLQWVGETICFVSAMIIFVYLFLPGVKSMFKLDVTRFNPQIRGQ